MRELLDNYLNFRNGKKYSFIEEDGFEQIITHYLEEDKSSEALEAADYGVELYPFSASLHIHRADAMVALKRYEDALHVLERAEALDAEQVSLYTIRTEALLALDRQEEAVALLEEALSHFEGEEKVNLLFELSDVYDDYESFEKVFDCLVHILHLDPCNEEALYKICFWTDYTGRNEESIRLHQWIIDEHPYAELAWFNLGAAYQGLKLYEKSIDAYQYAVAINEKFDYAYRNIGDAYIRLRRYKDAIEALQKVLELSLPEAVIYEAIGHCYDKLQQFAQARFYYKKASHLDSEDSQMLFKIAGTYMNEENWSRAIRYLQSALKLHLLQPEYNLALGRCYRQLGQYDEAVTYLGNVVRVRPRHMKGWIELLRCFYDAEMYEEGFHYAALAFEQTDSKPVFVYIKTAFLLAIGHTKQALEYLEWALRADPKRVKFFVEWQPSHLQLPSIVDLIARYKKPGRRKKNG